MLLSELSGAFAITAETGQADKQGVFKSARITMQFGGAHLASPQRWLQSSAFITPILLFVPIPAGYDSPAGTTARAVTLAPAALSRCYLDTAATYMP